MPKIRDIAAALKADLTGDGEIIVEGINHPAAAGPQDLALALEDSALSALGESAAPAAIVARGAETPARLRAVIAVDFPALRHGDLDPPLRQRAPCGNGNASDRGGRPLGGDRGLRLHRPLRRHRARGAHRPGNGHPSPCHHRRPCPDRRRMPVPSRRQDRRAGRDRRPGHPASQLQHRGRWLQLRHSRAGIAAAARGRPASPASPRWGP